jgi:hypothetical protein
VWAAGEHLNKIVVETVVQLSLKIPFESSGIYFSGSQKKAVRVLVDAANPKSDHYFNARRNAAGFPIE